MFSNLRAIRSSPSRYGKSFRYQTSNPRKKKVDNPKKFQKEFESFKNHIGKHQNWFDALTLDQQWNLLFQWKNWKYQMKSVNKTPSLKKFLARMKTNRNFFVSKLRIRESTLNKLLS